MNSECSHYYAMYHFHNQTLLHYFNSYYSITHPFNINQTFLRLTVPTPIPPAIAQSYLLICFTKSPIGLVFTPHYLYKVQPSAKVGRGSNYINMLNIVQHY